MSKKVSIKLVRSPLGRLPNQRATVKALGLHKMDSCVEVMLNPAVQGMINTVAHLVEVKEI
jgi:large subunit ribosomal protein L30